MYVLNSFNEIGLTLVAFRSLDGSATNTTKALHLPLDYFANSKVVTFKSKEILGITITYPQLAEFLDKAERLQRTRQPATGEESIRKKSSRRTKKRKRPFTLTEQISLNREREFRNAEREVDRRTVVEDSDF